MISNLTRLWCELVHGDASTMHPIRGQYECRTCMRKWPVRWEPEARTRPVDQPEGVVVEVQTNA